MAAGCPGTGDEPRTVRQAGRLTFLALLLVFLLVDVRMLWWLPGGADSADFFNVFAISYNEFYQHKELANWLPYGGYGQPNLLYNLMELSSLDVLMILVGKVLGVRNVLLMFHLSLVGEHVVFLFGLFLLTRLMFRTRGAVVFACLASLFLLTPLQVQFIVIFRILSWFPLMVYFLAQFGLRRRPRCFWTAGIVFVLWCPGNCYLPPYMLLALVPFLFLPHLRSWAVWRSLTERSVCNLATFGCCAGMAGLYLYLASHCTESLAILRPGRSVQGGESPMDFTLVSAGWTPASKVLGSLVSGGNFYVGLLTLVFFLWGLVHVRTPFFLANVAALFLLVWFAVGGYFTLALLHVPLFSLTRNVFMGYWLMRVPILLGAASAWDAFWTSGLKGWTLLQTALVAALGVDVVHQMGLWYPTRDALQTFCSSWEPMTVRLSAYAVALGVGLLTALGLRALGRRTGWRPFRSWRGCCLPLQALLLLALVGDAFSYHYMGEGLTIAPPWTYTGFKQLPFRFAAHYPEPFKVHPLDWQEQRLPAPPTPERSLALSYGAYMKVYTFAGFDPCTVSANWLQSTTQGVHRFLEVSQSDESTAKVLGRQAPKLRLMSEVRCVADAQEAEEAIRTATDLDRVAVLTRRGAPSAAPPPGPDGPVGDVRVTAFRCNALTIAADVRSPGGAWLVYADGFHPGWRATVNGVRAEVAPAYVGFKAVRVTEGRSQVRLEFRDPKARLYMLLAVLGAGCGACFLAWCVTCCLVGFPRIPGNV